MGNFLAILYGIVFGIANIIPGVSGGTMLVVFGCYDKVCGALTLNLKEIKKNIVFLVFFGIGTLIGIFGFAFLITWLLADFPLQTNLFFMGLIAGSVPLIIRNATVNDKFSPRCILPFIAGLVAVVALTVAQNNSAPGEQFRMDVTVENGSSYVALTNMSDRTVNKWTLELKEYVITEDDIIIGGAQIKCDQSFSRTLEQLRMIQGDLGPNRLTITGEFPPDSVCAFICKDSVSIAADNVKLSAGYSLDAGMFAWLLFAMFIAAVAMIIPGVSGSFVMVTLGAYATVVGAVKSLDIITLIPVAAGAVLGIVVGARLVTLLLKKFRLMTFSVILGLVAGSLYAILPAGLGLNLATLAGVFAMAAGALAALTVGKKTKVEAA